MGGAADHPSHRSSSPLKRPASSMDQTVDDNVSTQQQQQQQLQNRQEAEVEEVEDVEMVNSPGAAEQDPDRAAAEEVEQVEDISTTKVTAPDIEQQIKTIEGLVRAFNSEELKEGTAAYLVSRKWLNQAQTLGSGDVVKIAKEVPEGKLGPVDNSDIADGIVKDIDDQLAVRLIPGIGQESFELFPKSAWDLLLDWYGLAQGQIAIVRYAHNTSLTSSEANMQFELHPPVFTLRRLWSTVSGIPHDKEMANINAFAPAVMCTSSCNLQVFMKRAKKLLHIPISRPVRIWRIQQKLATGNAASNTGTSTPVTTAAASVRPSMLSLSTPPDSPKLGASNSSAMTSSGATNEPSNTQGSWPRALLEATEFMKLDLNSEREQLSQFKDLTHDKNYNGKITLAFISLTVDNIIVLDEHVEGSNSFVSTYHLKGAGRAKDKGTASNTSARASHHGHSTGVSSALATAANSGRSSPIQPGPVTRGRTKQKSGRTMGCVGLSNLGNTCYMNSALQCVRSVEELTKYFLVHENQLEINYDNPLGHGGNVANSYAHLLDEMYKIPSPISISPRNFKSTIGRYAPSFSGYGQQDSQEFLGFLLDGLQEDLSRVKKKPYIEKPDSTDEMINNPAAIREMAEKVWDITKRRDDSVIADLFTGMYKSTLICPVCEKVSITFDPFTNLTLPLPIQNVWSKNITFVPLNDKPVNFDVDLDKTSSFRALKEFIGVRVGVPSERLVGVEELRDNIIKVFDDFACVSEEISNSDTIVVYEVEGAPTNLAASKLPRRRYRSMLNIDEEPDIPNWDSPMAERLLVPIIHRFDPEQRTRDMRSGLVAPPHFILLNREEAGNEDVIRRKILEKVASYSTWAEFAKAEEEDRFVIPAKSETAAGEIAGNGVATTPSNSSINNSSNTPEDGSSDGVMVGTNGSDADSAGDSKVTAKSVEGEDDMVDVTMKDAADANVSSNAKQTEPDPKILYHYNRHRPKWVVNPDMYLSGELQNLFDLCYYDDVSNTIPIKWSGPNDEKQYPKLRSRIPQRPPPPAPIDEEMHSPSNWDSSEGSGDDTNGNQEEITPDSEPVASDDPPTRMVDESDEDEDATIPSGQQLAFRGNSKLSGNVANKVGGPSRHKRFTAHQKTYGYKGSKRRPKHLHTVSSQVVASSSNEDNETSHPRNTSPSPATTTTSRVDEGPLIRLGEGIMVDWNPVAWDVVFGRDATDDADNRGEPTYKGPVPTLEDPALLDKRRARVSRRKRGLTLDECLDEFEREEILSENDTWYCPRCKEHRRASKKFDLWKTPDILVVHLKRFSSSGWRRDKLDSHVDFPVEGLDLTKRVLDRQTGKQEIYDLIGVDDHWGGLGGGHYTAYAKSFIDNQWYDYNDSSVSKVSDSSSVVTSAAYLLFYRRRSDKALGGPRLQRIVDRFNRELLGSDDDGASDSGEGRRLDAGSSSTGLSGASKGALAGGGAALHPRASPGLASSSTTSSQTLNAADDPDYLPSYSQANSSKAILRGGDSSPSSADDYEALGSGAIHSSSVLNFGAASSNPDKQIRKSIEMEDRSPSVTHRASQDTSWTQQSWSFGPAADAPGSGDAEAGGEATDSDKMSLGTAVTAEEANTTPPPPDLFNQANMDDIQKQVWARKEEAHMHRIMPGDGDDDNVSEKAVDIHIGEEDETETAKMG